MNDHAAESGDVLLSRKELAVIAREITRKRMEQDIRRYADNPKLESRHVEHGDNIEAVRMLLKDLRKIGRRQLWFREQPFVIRKDPKTQRENVEAMLPGINSDEVVIVAAHLDCTGERDPSYRPRRDRAPGADDDASGMAGVLAAARAIVTLAAAQDPGERRAEIRFVLFNAEELAQRGSRVYARREEKLGTPITAVYQMDMIGYRRRGATEFELHAGFKRNPAIEAASLRIARHLARVCEAANIPLTTQIYRQRGKTRDPGQGFSDHTSFHRRGYPAIMVSENFFPGQNAGEPPAQPNPDYHMPEDAIGNIDPGYATNIARAVTAAAWHWATRAGCARSHASAGVHEDEAPEHEAHEHEPESHKHKSQDHGGEHA
ncbi:MAG TPA: M28 family metallopeptidase [Longimicrobium sp.]|nr:M28 family metallopeptidase [Longimicrobium sp.]